MFLFSEETLTTLACSRFVSRRSQRTRTVPRFSLLQLLVRSDRGPLIGTRNGTTCFTVSRNIRLLQLLPRCSMALATIRSAHAYSDEDPQRAHIDYRRIQPVRGDPTELTSGACILGAVQRAHHKIATRNGLHTPFVRPRRERSLPAAKREDGQCFTTTVRRASAR